MVLHTDIVHQPSSLPAISNTAIADPAIAYMSSLEGGVCDVSPAFEQTIREEVISANF